METSKDLEFCADIGSFSLKNQDQKMPPVGIKLVAICLFIGVLASTVTSIISLIILTSFLQPDSTRIIRVSELVLHVLPVAILFLVLELLNFVRSLASFLRSPSLPSDHEVSAISLPWMLFSSALSAAGLTLYVVYVLPSFSALQACSTILCLPLLPLAVKLSCFTINTSPKRKLMYSLAIFSQTAGLITFLTYSAVCKNSSSDGLVALVASIILIPMNQLHKFVSPESKLYKFALSSPRNNSLPSAQAALVLPWWRLLWIALTLYALLPLNLSISTETSTSSTFSVQRQQLLLDEIGDSLETDLELYESRRVTESSREELRLVDIDVRQQMAPDYTPITVKTMKEHLLSIYRATNDVEKQHLYRDMEYRVEQQPYSNHTLVLIDSYMRQCLEHQYTENNAVLSLFGVPCTLISVVLNVLYSLLYLIPGIEDRREDMISSSSGYLVMAIQVVSSTLAVLLCQAGPTFKIVRWGCILPTLCSVPVSLTILLLLGKFQMILPKPLLEKTSPFISYNTLATAIISALWMVGQAVLANDWKRDNPEGKQPSMRELVPLSNFFAPFWSLKHRTMHPQTQESLFIEVQPSGENKNSRRKTCTVIVSMLVVTAQVTGLMSLLVLSTTSLNSQGTMGSDFTPMVMVVIFIELINFFKSLMVYLMTPERKMTVLWPRGGCLIWMVLSGSASTVGLCLSIFYLLPRMHLLRGCVLLYAMVMLPTICKLAFSSKISLQRSRPILIGSLILQSVAVVLMLTHNFVDSQPTYNSRFIWGFHPQNLLLIVGIFLLPIPLIPSYIVPDSRICMRYPKLASFREVFTKSHFSSNIILPWIRVVVMILMLFAFNPGFRLDTVSELYQNSETFDANVTLAEIRRLVESDIKINYVKPSLRASHLSWQEIDAIKMDPEGMPVDTQKLYKEPVPADQVISDLANLYTHRRDIQKLSSETVRISDLLSQQKYSTKTSLKIRSYITAVNNFISSDHASEDEQPQAYTKSVRRGLSALTVFTTFVTFLLGHLASRLNITRTYELSSTISLLLVATLTTIQCQTKLIFRTVAWKCPSKNPHDMVLVQLLIWIGFISNVIFLSDRSRHKIWPATYFNNHLVLPFTSLLSQGSHDPFHNSSIKRPTSPTVTSHNRIQETSST